MFSRPQEMSSHTTLTCAAHTPQSLPPQAHSGKAPVPQRVWHLPTCQPDQAVQVSKQPILVFLTNCGLGISGARQGALGLPVVLGVQGCAGRGQEHAITCRATGCSGPWALRRKAGSGGTSGGF